MNKIKLLQIILDHQLTFQKQTDLIFRDIDFGSCLKGGEIVLIFGLCHCGKTSLFKILSRQLDGIKIYIDFDDVQLADFGPENFLCRTSKT